MQVNGGAYTDFDHFVPLVATYQKTDFESFGLSFKGINLQECASNPNSFIKHEGVFADDIIYDNDTQELQVGYNPFDNTEPGVYKFYVRQTLTSFWKIIATITITN